MPVNKYPHMKLKEADIWDRFLSHLPWEALRITYDLRLGQGAVIPPDQPDWVARMVWALSTKRVDVVVETRDTIWLVEVKERAGLSAVGQLMGYAALYRNQLSPRKPLMLACICRRIAPDMHEIFARYQIRSFVV